MENFVYFTIFVMCILLEPSVLKAYAYYADYPHGNDCNDYQEQEQQQQQLSFDTFQLQDQTSTQYRCQTYKPLGEHNGIYGPIQEVYVSQMQQKQQQNSLVYNNGFVHESGQYQHQNGLHQMQHQYTAYYKDSEPHRGQHFYGENPVLTTKGPNNYELVGRIRNQLSNKYYAIANNESGKLQYVMTTTQMPIYQKVSQPHRGQHFYGENPALTTKGPNNYELVGSIGNRPSNKYVSIPNNAFEKSQYVMTTTQTPKLKNTTNVQNTIAHTDILSPHAEQLEQKRSVIEAYLYKQKYKIKCPLNVHGIYPHPFSNVQYIKCFNGRLLIKPCGRGRLFSLSRRNCDIKDFVLTFDTAVPVWLPQNSMDESEYHQIHREIKAMNLSRLVCPRGVSGTFVYPFLATRYIKCFNGRTNIETCSNGEIYSIRRQRCMPYNLVDSNDYVESFQDTLTTDLNASNFGIICGPNSEGKYVHPEDQSKYILCYRGRIKVMRCRAGKMFDIENFRCNN